MWKNRPARFASRGFIGILLCIVGIVLALWAGLYLMLYLGAVQAITAIVEASSMSSLDVSDLVIGFIRVLLSGVVIQIVTVVFFVPGITLIKYADVNYKLKIRKRNAYFRGNRN